MQHPWGTAARVVLPGRITTACAQISIRYAQLREDPERGSISVEKAIIAAISVPLALAVMAAITAVVTKYTGMIK